MEEPKSDTTADVDEMNLRGIVVSTSPETSDINKKEPSKKASFAKLNLRFRLANSKAIVK